MTIQTALTKTEAEALGRIRHRFECAASSMDSLQKTLWFIGEHTSGEEVCSVFYAVGNNVEALKREIDDAVHELKQLEDRMERRSAPQAA